MGWSKVIRPGLFYLTRGISGKLPNHRDMENEAWERKGRFSDSE